MISDKSRLSANVNSNFSELVWGTGALEMLSDNYEPDDHPGCIYLRGFWHALAFLVRRSLSCAPFDDNSSVGRRVCLFAHVTVRKNCYECGQAVDISKRLFLSSTFNRCDDAAEIEYDWCLERNRAMKFER